MAEAEEAEKKTPQAAWLPFLEALLESPPIPADELAQLEEELEEKKRTLAPEELEKADLSIPREEPVLAEEDIVSLILALHWWGRLNITEPLGLFTLDQLRAACELVLEGEDELIWVNRPTSPMWLSNVPQHAKDAFCINLFCLDGASQMQAVDFLLPAFSLYPEKDICVLTQPHVSPQSPLLSHFTIVPPKATNTFHHALYLVHRSTLLSPPVLRVISNPDIESVAALAEPLGVHTVNDLVEFGNTYIEKEADPLKQNTICYVAEVDSQVVGVIGLELLKDETVESLCAAYHLDDYLIAEYHDESHGKGHSRLKHWILNPLFLKFSRMLLLSAQRLAGRTVMHIESALEDIVPSVFNVFLQVAPRTAPALKKVKRKPPKVASFANIEKDAPTEEERARTEMAKFMEDGVQRGVCLSIVAKKLLSEAKIPVNSRIVVVGASDTGLSFLESLLAVPSLHFHNLTLLAPGGLAYHHAHHLPLVQGSAAYSHEELRRVMLELRVRVLDARMIQIHREDQHVILPDGSKVPYDFLVITAGLQDAALNSLKIRTWGLDHLTQGYRRVNGAMSSADPNLRNLLIPGGTLIKSLIWNPLSYAVVYGRSLSAYCLVQGLLLRQVPPHKILLVLPPRGDEDNLCVDAFADGDVVEGKIHKILAEMGISLFDGYRSVGVL